MSEDEAKEKWCFAFTASHTDPRAREYVATDGAFDSTASGPFRHHCIGSECMAWRWKTETYTPSGGDPLATRKPARNTEDGFCGLAGAPQ